MLNRRELLKSFGLGVVGVSPALFPRWIPKLAFASSAIPARAQHSGGRDVLVNIFLRGGMDGLNTVVPFGEGALYYDRRPTLAIPEPSDRPLTAINLDGYFGLHPALHPLKDIWEADALTIVHAAGSIDPTRSHFDAMEYMERGTPGAKTTPSGWINRHLETAAWQNDSPFRALGMGAMLQSSLRGTVSTLALKSISAFHLNGREDQLEAIQAAIAGVYAIQAPQDILQREAAQVYAAMGLLNTINPDSYTPENSADYPDTDFGNGLKQIAMLIKADLGLEVACVDLGGWDTHEGQGGTQGWHAELLTELGQGLSAFYADLGAWMRDVSVVTMSEFGRRLEENASGGTDHGHGNVMFIMGGGARRQLYADWVGLSPELLDDGDLAVTTDYRDILSEILLVRLGNDQLTQIFPNYTPNIRGILRPRA
jgi:uncharacterized protein (DUF1501 family)